jgi:hypothetical protein
MYFQNGYAVEDVAVSQDLAANDGRGFTPSVNDTGYQALPVYNLVNVQRGSGDSGYRYDQRDAP